MSTFPFQSLNFANGRHVGKEFTCVNVTQFKYFVEKEYSLTNIKKILYFIVHPLISGGIHMDMDITRYTHETRATFYLLTDASDLYFHIWKPISLDCVFYIPRPTNLIPPSKTPFLSQRHAILQDSIKISHKLELDISEFHNVENRSPSTIVEFLSVRF